MNNTFNGYGLSIADSEGDLRDISGILSVLKEVRENFSTRAMSDHALFLEGKLEMLEEVIEYLEFV